MSEPVDIWAIARKHRNLANARLCEALRMRPIGSARAMSAVARADLAVSDADVDLMRVSHLMVEVAPL